jgi:hypothetical protein
MTTDTHTIETPESETLDLLARRINQRICVLFLGPGLCKIDSGLTLHVAFAHSLAEELDQEKISYDATLKSDAGYMINRFVHGYNQKRNSNVIKMVDVRDRFFNFCKKNPPQTDLYNLLAELPFPLVINANADDLFYQLAKTHRPTEFGFYDLSNREQVKAKERSYAISRDNPLVYNLFGYASDESLNSLVLSEKELLNYVGSIHQANMLLPREISKFIDKEKYCLFLGFNFNDWLLKILIRVLWSGEGLEEKNSLPDVLAIDRPAPNAETFYTDEFNFCFINNDLEHFVRKLYDRLHDTKAGTTTPAPPAEGDKRALNIVFILDYTSIPDCHYRDQIVKHLKILNSGGQIKIWSEDMHSGVDKEKKRQEKITQADLAVWLVSSDFADKEKYHFTEEFLQFNHQPHLRHLAVLIRPFHYTLIESMKEFNWYPQKKDDDGKVLAIDSGATAAEKEKSVSELAVLITDIITTLKAGL